MAINPKKVVKMATSKKCKSLKIKDIDLKVDNFSIDDLNKENDNYLKLKTLLDTVSSCQISDAYNNLYRTSGVIKGLKSLTGVKGYGKIKTCQTDANDWGSAVAGIDFTDKKEVLFIKTSDEPIAVWGELASTCAKESEIAAVAVYGNMRDVDVIKYMDYPLFSRDYCPNAGTPLGIGKLNLDLEIDGVIIKEGDFFFGDENGVVIIPSEKFNEVIIETFKIKLKEESILKMLKEGKTLAEIVNVKDNFKN